MLYAVDKYLDQIRQKESARSDDHYIYFESEEDAKELIRKRAASGLLDAEAKLKKAWNRLRKVQVKFAAAKKAPL